MANIGIFSKTRSGYEGTITTLTLCMSARFVPNRNKRSETSPDFFIKAGDSDLGVGWKTASQGDNPTEYVRCVLDDPCFAAPIQAALFPRADGADLVGSRPKRSE